MNLLTFKSPFPPPSLLLSLPLPLTSPPPPPPPSDRCWEDHTILVIPSLRVKLAVKSCNGTF